MTAPSDNSLVSSSSGVSPPPRSSPSPSPSSSDSRVRKNRSDVVKPGDAWLQSTNKRRRYMRRGSKVSTMLMASTFEVRQCFAPATTTTMMPPSPPPQRPSTGGSVIETTFVSRQQNQELSSVVEQQRQSMLLQELVAGINDSMFLLSMSTSCEGRPSTTETMFNATCEPKPHVHANDDLFRTNCFCVRWT
jgi:hypothetical protein